MGGGGSSGGTSTTTRDIPDELKGAATAYSGLAMNLANTPYQAYTGQGTASLNGNQNNAISMIANRAANGSPVLDQANSTLTSMLGDQTNPYLDAQVQKAQQSVVKNFNGAQAGSGSFGNSGLQEELGKGLSDTASTMYGNAYNTNQANKLQALGMAQSYGNQAYTDANALMGAGQTQQANDQAGKDFQYQQFQNQQNYPLQQIAALGGVINGSSGSTTTQSGGGGK
jgi:hypothetical protein